MSASRRHLLLGGASLVLAGCGARADVEDTGFVGSQAGRRPDADVLAEALTTKRAALEAHGDVSLARAERRHVARLETELRRLDRQGEAFAVTHSQTAVEAEQHTIAVLQRLLPQLADRRLRGLLADMLVEDAQQLAALHLERGEEAAPDAFLDPEPLA